MSSLSGIMREFQRPPTRSNLSIWNIIQIIIMLIIGILKVSEFYSSFKGNMLFTVFIRIIVDGLIILGIIIFAYGLLAEQSKFLKLGLLLFLCGSFILIFFSFFELFKEKSIIKSIFEIIIYGFISWVIFTQIPHI